MATPKKLPSGKWRVRGCYIDPVTGKAERPSFTADSKDEAKRMLAEWENVKADPCRKTVEQCVKEYIAVKTPVLSPATIRGYLAMIDRYEPLNPIQANLISDSDMQAFVSRLALHYSPKSVRNTYGLLVSALGMFSARKYNVTLPQKQKKVYAIPTDAGVRLLLERANPHLKKAIALAAIATLRAGEVCALRYGDIDREAKTIHVHADMVRDKDGKWIIKAVPKTSSSDRFIPVPSELLDLLGDGESDQLVYGRTMGAINRSFITLRKKCGLTCRFHDLRHYAASIMHAIGVPDQYIMERGGWKSDTVLKSVYRNSISDQSKKFQEVANEHFKMIL